MVARSVIYLQQLFHVGLGNLQKLEGIFMKIKFKSKALLSLLTAVSLAPSFIPTVTSAQELNTTYSESVVVSNGETVESLIEPVMGPHGYFVDVFHTNRAENQSPYTNGVIGVLSEFLELFEPGVDSESGAEDRWKLGTVLNEVAHLENIEKTKEIVETASEEQIQDAYLIDRRNQNYSAIFGLGEFVDAFMAGASADTSIPDEVPADANTNTYDEEATWAQVESEFGAIANLVEVVRAGSASTNPSKNFYQYARPYRWNGIDSDMPEVEVVDSLIPRMKPEDEATNDGGFPSGHTNASYMASLAMAYSVPEQMHSLVLNASELGNSRVVAGMHSVLDVMGGRMSGTAITTANLADDTNEEAKVAAYEAGRALLAANEGAAVDGDIYDENPELYDEHRQLYLDRLTYNMTPDEDMNENARVPKEAEVLLETRFPYLDEAERRFVLLTTAIQSGHPVANDAEGFGRMNLFDAASGYGSFVKDTVVNMDAELGGFSAYDTFRNDIDGTGSLTKQGSGVLALTGDNSYSGATVIDGGTVIAKSASALGAGHVVNNGVLEVDSDAGLVISGYLAQEAGAELVLVVDSMDDVLSIAEDSGALAGTVRIVLADGFELGEEGFGVINLPEGFDASDLEVVVEGGPEGVQVVETEAGFELSM